MKWGNSSTQKPNTWQSLLLSFPHFTKPEIYDTTIPDDATDGLCVMKEAVHKAVRNDYGIYEAAEEEPGVLEVVDVSIFNDF